MSYVNDFTNGDGPHLSDLLPSVGAHLGVPGLDQDLIGLPPASRYVVVLVDGLGWDLLMRACVDAPYAAGVIGDAVRVDVCRPTTTAASLMSLWTGASPGEHGIVGFSFELDRPSRRSQPSQVITPLFVEEPVPSLPPVMDRMVDAGVAVSCVVPAEHVASGLTRMGTRAAHMIGVDISKPHSRCREIQQASRRGQRSLVYVYEPRLDQVGHKYGVASDQWRATLAIIDDFLFDLRQLLDDDVTVLVTGDHGMVDVAPEDRVVIDDDPVLRDGVRLVGGEARFRHLYTDQPDQVARRWRDRLQDRASVMTRGEAVEAGIFGRVDPAYAPRIGDVVVQPTSTGAYLTRSFPGEFYLVGMHGGWTSQERSVPILID